MTTRNDAVLLPGVAADPLLLQISRPEKAIGERVRLYNLDADEEPYLDSDDHGIIIRCPRRGYFEVKWFNESCMPKTYNASQLYALKRLEYDESREYDV
jgi:hypothetical protein